MKAIYMTYRKSGGEWEEYIPSRTLSEARGVVRMSKAEDREKANYKVKKIMVADGEFDIIASEFFDE